MNSDDNNDLPLSSFMVYRLNLLSHLANRASAHWHEQRSGLSVAEWRIVATLGFFGAGSPSDIAEQTQMDKAVISRVKTSLSRKGIVVDQPDQDDSRKRLLSLSEEGQRIYDETMPEAQRRQKDLMSHFSARELATIDESFSKLQTFFEKVLEEGPEVVREERLRRDGRTAADPARPTDRAPSVRDGFRSGAGQG